MRLLWVLYPQLEAHLQYPAQSYYSRSISSLWNLGVPCAKIVLPNSVAKFSVNFNTAGVKGFKERKMIMITNAKRQYYTLTIKADVL